MYQHYNPNPQGKAVEDYTVRALTKALGMNWENVYFRLFLNGWLEADMPSSNIVFENLLKSNGFTKHILQDSMSIHEFLENNKIGKYVLCTGSYVVFAKNGIYYDSWDSGNEPVIYYFHKED